MKTSRDRRKGSKSTSYSQRTFKKGLSRNSVTAIFVRQSLYKT